MMEYGGEKYNASGPAGNYLHMSNNVFIEDRNTGTFCMLYREPPSVAIGNNTFIGKPSVDWSGNTQYISRAAAGIPPFPFLPAPAACTTPRPPVAAWAERFAASFRFEWQQ